MYTRGHNNWTTTTINSIPIVFVASGLSICFYTNCLHVHPSGLICQEEIKPATPGAAEVFGVFKNKPVGTSFVAQGTLISVRLYAPVAKNGHGYAPLQGFGRRMY